VTWARVDDSFATHPKVDVLPEGLRLPCLGVWVLALATAAQHQALASHAEELAAWQTVAWGVVL
jgi:hypothetical protein